MRAQIYLPKRDRDERKSRWENLDPFLPGWVDIPHKVHEVSSQFFFYRQSFARSPGPDPSPPPTLRRRSDQPPNDPAGERAPGGDDLNSKPPHDDPYVDIGGVKVKTEEVVDLTESQEDEYFTILKSIEEEIFGDGNQDVAEDIEFVIPKLERRSTEVPEVAINDEVHPTIVANPNEDSRRRQLKRCMAFTRGGNKRPRIQGSAPP
jgi:hypothetical protein